MTVCVLFQESGLQLVGRLNTNSDLILWDEGFSESETIESLVTTHTHTHVIFCWVYKPGYLHTTISLNCKNAVFPLYLSCLPLQISIQIDFKVRNSSKLSLYLNQEKKINVSMVKY